MIVGTGTSTSRRTSFYVSASGVTVARDGMSVSGSFQYISGSSSGSVITNIGDSYTDVPAVTSVVTLTSSSYGALLAAGTTDPNTLYVISGSNLLATVFPYSGSAQITGSLGVTGSTSVNINGNTEFEVTETGVKLGNSSTDRLQFTGSLNVTGSLINTGSLSGNVVAASVVSSTASLDFSQGNFFTCLITGSQFFNITNTFFATSSVLIAPSPIS